MSSDMRGLPVAGSLRSGPDMRGLLVASGVQSGPDMRGLPTAYGVGTARLLDMYPGAVSAYSIARRLSNAATAAYRIERASDTAQLDIAFDGEEANTAAAQTFVGGSTGGIRTLYDQARFLAGTGAHLAAFGGAPLPRLINAGVLDVQGIKPTIVFAGTGGNGIFVTNDSSWGTNVGLSGNPAMSVFIVSKKTAIASGMLMGWGETSVSLQAAGFFDDNTGPSGAAPGFAFAGPNFFQTTEPANNTYYLSTFIKRAGAINTTSQSYRNGMSVAAAGSSANTPAINGGRALALGRFANYTLNQLLGNVQEMIIYASDQSANRAGIEANIRAYYGM